MGEHDLITWTKDLEVGITFIDQQHRKLVDILNRIGEALAENVEYWIIGSFIEELEQYTQYHFTAEQEMMQKYNYPEADSHEHKHDYFIEQLKDAVESYKMGEAQRVIRDLRTFLKKWLASHILGTDKELAKFLKSKGVP
jgi:hemerythrin-like metal-binding protein